ncbi:response regulator transcription factor [Sulfurimonas microaerophilic]|uniref:response regulator transcription factor n=1 Tax=Sulfurimonas microaerophilic TaxID=3058392 RepID=UPI002714BFB6|nr:response regulator transcription factor [Sulfurimonas sp. hsl 1-7]
MKILLLEDELHLRNNITKYFTIKGHDVDAYENGEELLKDANPADYDCMILDINTPEIDGFEVLEYIRNNNINTPALYISALTDAQKVLRGFELGAGDYLKKPFEFVELELRMLRIASAVTETQKIKLNNFSEYDYEKRELYIDGQIQKLSVTQKRFVYILVKHKNALVSFEMLRDYVWEGKDISHSTILSTMRNLKTIFRSQNIRNVKGEGYMLEIIN